MTKVFLKCRQVTTRITKYILLPEINMYLQTTFKKPRDSYNIASKFSQIDFVKTMVIILRYVFKA